MQATHTLASILAPRNGSGAHLPVRATPCPIEVHPGIAASAACTGNRRERDGAVESLNGKNASACRWTFSLVFLPVALLSGCASLPEVGPFVEASAQLRAGVASSGEAVAAELKRIEGGAKLADQLATEWAQRVKACDALVRYADSLQAIAKAGREGRQTAQSIADSVSALAGAASIALPGAQVVGTVTDAAKFIFAQISLARAADSLDNALSAAAPAVDEIAAQIARDLGILERIVSAASETSKNALTSDNSNMLGFRNQLNKARESAYAKVSTMPAASLTRELEDINKLMDTTRSLNEAYEKQVADLAKRRNAASALVRASSDAVIQWAAAHRQLVAAVRDRRPVNSQSLIEATSELRDLIKRARDL